MKEEILRGRILLFMEKNKLSKLKEKFNNKTKAVIVGNGPSISKIDWDKIVAQEKIFYFYNYERSGEKNLYYSGDRH